MQIFCNIKKKRMKEDLLGKLKKALNNPFKKLFQFRS